MSEYRNEFTAEDLELLSYLLEQEGIEGGTHLFSIDTIERQGDHPLSFAQERLWIFDQLTSSSAASSIPCAFRLIGTPDIVALQQSISEIVRRHESLRSIFPEEGGYITQKILAPYEVPLPINDLRKLPEFEQHAEITRLLREEIHRPFDLSSGPLLRTTLFQVDEAEFLFLLVVHHIAFDGWSIAVFVRELSTLYAALSSGSTPYLPELAIQYVDFAAWQRKQLTDGTLNGELAYWKQKLQAAPMLMLPADHQRPAQQTLRGASYLLHLPYSLYTRLLRLCEAEQVTPFMATLAAFASLLFRYTGQDDFLIGTPVANRDQVETEALIGLLINTLALRFQFSEEMLFIDALRCVKETVLEGFANQHFPIEKLVHELQIERDLSYNPLTQVFFVYQKAVLNELSLPGLSLQQLPVGTDTAKFDLTLTIDESQQGLTATFQYSIDLFEADTIERMAHHLQCFLEGAVANPSQRIATLPLLPPSEYQQVINQWNTAAGDFGKPACMHQLFEAQAQQFPDRIAVCFQDQMITYQALNQRANQLAHHLRRLGVGMDTPVGIYTERSLDTIYGMLAILKAGGAYVPLDPTSPPDRLEYILQDTSVFLVLTQQTLISRFSHLSIATLCLNGDIQPFTGEAIQNLSCPLTPGQLAYVLYTSGSTGKPKGILVEHAQLYNYTLAVLDRLQLTGAASFAMVQPLTVDSCLTTIFPPLCTGGSLHILTHECSIDPQAFTTYFAEHTIDVLKIAPSHLLALQTARSTSACMPRLRLIIGGEASRWQWVQELQRQNPTCTIFNHYGPTETTVGALMFQVKDAPINSHDTTTPLGTPLANTTIYLLDRSLQPVPVGIPGELYISGANLARGYLNRPDLTASHFIPNPFRQKAGTRMYRTGDLARFRSDGTLEFLGRIDNQMKIRGFRVEPAEIEAVLAQHPAIREALILPREDGRQQKHLIAYVVLQHTLVDAATELRTFLSHSLPEYMLPMAFVFLDAMPRSPHGKIAYKDLPAPTLRQEKQQHSSVETLSHVEQLLLTIWTQVLGLDRISVHDNFFSLGGDSILSIQIIAKAKQAGLQITPRLLLGHQTIHELAQVLPAVAPTHIEQQEAYGSVPLTPIQQQFFRRCLPEPDYFNQALQVELLEPINPELLSQAIQHLLQHHDAFRLRFLQTEDGWQQFYTEENQQHPELQCFDYRHLTPEEQEQAIIQTANDLHTRLCLQQGPLLQVAFFHLRPGQPDRLLIIVHHLIIDGISWRILLEDLQTLCEQLRKHASPLLPMKTTSFQAWAIHLQDRAHSPAIEGERDYWQRILSAARTSLPMDQIGAENDEASARTVAVLLGQEATSDLLQVPSYAQHIRVIDVLLTALILAYRRWAGESSLLFNLESHGREEISANLDLSRTIGWFTSIFPVLLDCADMTQPEDVLAHVKENLHSIPGNGLGYGLLRYLAVQRLPDIQPQVSFNYYGRVIQEELEESRNHSFQLRLPGLSIGTMRSPRGPRAYVLEINTLIVQGQLHVEWTYSHNIHRQETIDHLAEHYMQELQAIINTYKSKRIRFTPSDFPAAQLEAQELADFLASIGQTHE